jgi:hypothetical protein
MSRSKWENRALTRGQMEVLIHTVVNYVAKNRRHRWSQLTDAGITCINLQTDRNILPAIARQARCHRIMGNGGVDIPGHEPQFYFELERPVSILQSPFGYGRTGGPNDQDENQSFCCCFRQSKNLRVCLINLDLTTLDKFRSVKQLPRTDLIQMLQTLEKEEIAIARKKRGWKVPSSDDNEEAEIELDLSGLPPPPILLTSEQPHILRLFFSFAKEKIHTIETLGTMSLEDLNALKEKIPGFSGKRYKIIMKRIKSIMDNRFETAKFIEEERIQQEIIKEAMQAEKIAEELKKKQECEIKDKEKNVAEMDDEEDGEDEEDGDGKEGGEKGGEENDDKDQEDRNNVNENETKDEDAKSIEEGKEVEEGKEDEEGKEVEEGKEDEEGKEHHQEEGNIADEKKEVEEEAKLEEEILISSPAIASSIYDKIDLLTTRTTSVQYLSREVLSDDQIFYNPNSKGKLISIYDTDGKEILLKYLLKSLYHLTYEDVLVKLNDILTINKYNVTDETKDHDEARYIISKRKYVCLGSYKLNDIWNLYIDIRVNSPIVGSRLAKTKNNSSILNYCCNKKIYKIKPMDVGQVGNYSPNETRELFIDLMLEVVRMRNSFTRTFQLREIKYLRVKFLIWKNSFSTKSKRKKYNKIGNTTPRKKIAVHELRKSVIKKYPYSEFKFLYQQIDALKTFSKMHSEHLKLTVAGQLRIGEEREDMDTIDRAADNSSLYAPEQKDIYLFKRLNSEVHLNKLDTIKCFTNSGILLPIVIQSTHWKDTIFPTAQCKDYCKAFWFGLYSCVRELLRKFLIFFFSIIFEHVFHLLIL